MCDLEDAYRRLREIKKKILILSKKDKPKGFTPIGTLDYLELPECQASERICQHVETCEVLFRDDPWRPLLEALDHEMGLAERQQYVSVEEPKPVVRRYSSEPEMRSPLRECTYLVPDSPKPEVGDLDDQPKFEIECLDGLPDDYYSDAESEVLAKELNKPLHLPVGAKRYKHEMLHREVYGETVFRSYVVEYGHSRYEKAKSGNLTSCLLIG